MKKFVSVITALILVLLLAASCGKSSQQDNTTVPDDGTVSHADTSSITKVKFTMESGDTFTVELYPQYAPKTVDNFVSLVENHAYDGTTFHRVIEGFMAQGGAFLPNGSQKSSPTIPGEMYNNGYTANTLRHERGVISMARQGGLYNSASNQFFICYQAAPHLDGEYAAFGKVIEGMETVDSFLEIERKADSIGQLSSPVTPIIIEKAEVIS